MRCKLCRKEVRAGDLMDGYCLRCEKIAHDAWMGALMDNERPPEVGA